MNRDPLGPGVTVVAIDDDPASLDLIKAALKQQPVEILTASESGTLMEFWHSTSIGNGRVNTFKWAHPDDGHVYVVSWDCDFPRQRLAYDVYGIMNVQFAVWGRIAD